MSKDTEGLLEWTGQQCRFCATAMLRAVSATTSDKSSACPGADDTPRPRLDLGVARDRGV